MFLRSFVGNLVSKSIIYLNILSCWVSCPFIIPKPSSAKLRFTVDLRAVNILREMNSLPMPIIEHKLRKLAKSTCYTVFYLYNGYLQFPLANDIHNFQYFVTPHGIFTPALVLHALSTLSCTWMRIFLIFFRNLS